MNDLAQTVPIRIAGLLKSCSARRKLSSQTYLFRQGDRQTSLFIVESGLIELAMIVPGRDAVPILSVGPGELIAWSALLTDQTMTCSAKATLDSELSEFPANEIESLALRDPELAKDFYRWIALGLAHRLTATRLQLLDLFDHPNA